MPKTTSDAHILVNMTYVSRATSDVDAKELGEILQEAQDNNAANGITGMLIFHNNYFLQTIEGPRAQINRLLYALMADKRHHDVQLLEARELKYREWPKWLMSYTSPSEAAAAIHIKYSTTVEFNPYLLSAESARGLMIELSSQSGEATV
ncbi:BLUF domain-containing protein [Psychrobacter frigidicola]|uniref:BLUF domain-containing protein n=1 Tax=Psychrobacter frigidicola TaxID=45611 RepID=A0A5C7A5T4_9GAMM|nr:BLUF domain-containing protein [Psychrobacter frigidicola]TXD96149.1 BLUF domain-containing protein [Psychrobacter frigidicola]